MADSNKLSGTERAAVLLMSLGDDMAADVLKLMGPKEVQKIGGAMASMSSITKQEVTTVLDEFVQVVDDQTALGIDSEDRVKKMLTRALGEEKAGGLIDRILLGRSSKGLEALKWMDSRSVAEVIRLEHPQIIAIVLAYLDSDHAAEVLGQMPDRLRPDILMRIASLDGIPPQALHELDEIMEKQFSGNNNVKSSSVGGLKCAANILNFMDSSYEADVMENIQEVDAELGDKIQDLMFVFDNLSEIDDRGIQALLREVSSESLILAMKGADEELKEKIFKNMSKRASEMLRDDLEAKGPVRLSEVETAQKEILTIARRLADSGEIVLGGAGQEEFV
ncbi:Flagellar motor switch protein FliG [hydrothermal vent metagenome]|uniref:Flagellar motor switch protein FliG n=1 Tax=hydrothermal vent metagenome TaxID=652676 RepID=A0A3B0YD16_9ZZZZ